MQLQLNIRSRYNPTLQPIPPPSLSPYCLPSPPTYTLAIPKSMHGRVENLGRIAGISTAWNLCIYNIMHVVTSVVYIYTHTHRHMHGTIIITGLMHQSYKGWPARDENRRISCAQSCQVACSFLPEVRLTTPCMHNVVECSALYSP